jgi:quinolinate synthase
MGLNSLKKLETVLQNMNNEILVDEETIVLAQKSLSRMINFKNN